MSESSEHEALADFLLRMEVRYPALAFVKHTPNEADGGGEKKRVPHIKKDGTVGWRAVPLEVLRAPSRGIKPGVWDWEFLAPNACQVEGWEAGHFDGIAIELKVVGNTLSPAQRRWEGYYRMHRWYTAIAYEWTFAAHLLVRWVGGDPEDCGL